MPGLDVQGIAWPFRFGPLGHANRVKGRERLSQNLVGIVLTKLGERFREKKFGTIGYQLVLRNVTATRMNFVTTLVSDSIALWEPRVFVSQISWVKRQLPRGEGGLFVRIPWEIKQINMSDIAEAKIGE